MSGDLGQTERQFSDAVVELAQMLGWFVKRDPTWRATAAAPGYPDLTMTNGRRIIFAELKLDNGRITKAQHEWLDALDGAAYESVQAHNVAAVVWRPKDWDEIAVVLAGRKCARCAYTERTA